MQPMMLAIIAVGVVVLGAAVSLAMADRRHAQLVPVRIKRDRR